MRKKGLIVSFCDRNDEYLNILNDDLQLNADINQLKFLQKLYKSHSIDPSVSDLYFDIALMKSSLNNPDSTTVSALICNDSDMISLWENLVSRFASVYGKKPPKLSEIARFALNESRLPDTESHISFDLCPTSPMPGSTINGFFKAGDVTLTLSGSQCDNGITKGMNGYLLRPSEGMEYEEFVLRVNRLFFNIQLIDAGAKFVPTSCDGLLFDIYGCSEGGEILTGALPFDSLYPDSLLFACLPGAIIFTRPRFEKNIDNYSKSENLYANLIFRSISDENKNMITSPEETVIKSHSFIEQCNICRMRTLKAELPSIYQPAEQLDVKSSTEAHIEAFRLGNDYYSSLGEIADGTDYAIAAKINPEDPSVIPFILAADAYIRNTGNRPFCADVLVGNKTDITVFRTKK